MKLYISDLHFYHEGAIKMDARSFPDVRTMNQYMIDQWNSKVKGGDMVIVLGDFFWTKNPDEVNYVLNRLSGKICLLEGNHDNLHSANSFLRGAKRPHQKTDCCIHGYSPFQGK